MHAGKCPVQGFSASSLPLHPRAGPPSLQPGRDESHPAARCRSRGTTNALPISMNTDSARAASRSVNRFGVPLRRHRQSQAMRTWTVMPAPRPATGIGRDSRPEVPASAGRISRIRPGAHRLLSSVFQQAGALATPLPTVRTVTLRKYADGVLAIVTIFGQIPLSSIACLAKQSWAGNPAYTQYNACAALRTRALMGTGSQRRAGPSDAATGYRVVSFAGTWCRRHDAGPALRDSAGRVRATLLQGPVNSLNMHMSGQLGFNSLSDIVT